jgi:hypothetical protein
MFGIGVLGTVNVPADASVTSEKLATNLVMGGTLAMGSQFSNRNRFINGDLSVWQRGTSFTASGYTADRWNASIATSSATITREAFALGQVDVPNEPEFYLQSAVTTTSAAGANVAIRQRIESVRSFAGQEVTLSFYMASLSTTPVAISYSQNFGTGGTPTATVQAYAGTVTPVDANWHRYSVTFTLPSIIGATLGTAGDDYLMIEIWMDAGSTFNTVTNSLGQRSGTYKFSSLQIESGAIPTPFEVVHRHITLEMCQRYYQKSFPYATVPAQNAGVTGVSKWVSSVGASTSTGTHDFAFPVLMRDTPTVTLYSPLAASAQAYNHTTSLSGSSTSAAVNSPRTFSLIYTTDTTSTNGSRWVIHWTANAEL